LGIHSAWINITGFVQHSRIRFLALIFFATAIAYAQVPKAYPLCHVQNLKLQNAPAEIPIMLETLDFGSNTVFSTAMLHVSNRGNRPIEQMLGLIEFSDAAGQYLLSIPLAIGTSEASFDRLPIHLGLREGMDAPLGPKETVYMHGDVGLTTTHCPKTARVSLFYVEFVNGESVTFKTPHWRSDPVLLHATEVGLNKGSENQPSEALVEMQVNQLGQITRMRVKQGDQALLPSLESQLSNWSFKPSSVDGQPVTTLVEVWLSVLHRIPDTANPPKIDLTTATRVMPVAVISQTPFNSGPAVFYSGLPLN
jgi:hypothetical protein